MRQIHIGAVTAAENFTCKLSDGSYIRVPLEVRCEFEASNLSRLGVALKGNLFFLTGGNSVCFSPKEHPVIYKRVDKLGH